jgi:flagellar protein FlaG
LRKGNLVENTADRQRSVTSYPIDNSTGENISGVSEVFSEGRKNNGESSSELINVTESVEKLNELVQSQQTNVSFSVDKDTGTTVIKVFDTETGDLIKQFPPEQIVAMKEKLTNSLGSFYDTTV